MRPRFNLATLADLERRRELKEAAYRRKQRGKWQGHDQQHEHTPIVETFKPDPLPFFMRPEPGPRPSTFPQRVSWLTLPDSLNPRPAGLYAVLEAAPLDIDRRKAKARRKKATRATRRACIVRNTSGAGALDPAPEPAAPTHDDHSDTWLGSYSPLFPDTMEPP